MAHNNDAFDLWLSSANCNDGQAARKTTPPPPSSRSRSNPSPRRTRRAATSYGTASSNQGRLDSNQKELKIKKILTGQSRCSRRFGGEDIAYNTSTVLYIATPSQVSVKRNMEEERTRVFNLLQRYVLYIYSTYLDLLKKRPAFF